MSYRPDVTLGSWELHLQVYRLSILKTFQQASKTNKAPGTVCHEGLPKAATTCNSFWRCHPSKTHASGPGLTTIPPLLIGMIGYEMSTLRKLFLTTYTPTLLTDDRHNALSPAESCLRSATWSSWTCRRHASFASKDAHVLPVLHGSS
jgi:hypothetical protein